jgi:hypothetical protein
MKIFNFTQHKATPEQIAAGVVDLPDAVAATVRNHLNFEELPDTLGLSGRAESVAAIAKVLANKGDKVMIGGAPFFMPYLERALSGHGMRFCYAFSRRVSVEETTPDGTVRKVSVFKHEGFVG